jgi:hypothetical protein
MMGSSSYERVYREPVGSQFLPRKKKRKRGYGMKRGEYISLGCGVTENTQNSRKCEAAERIGNGLGSHPLTPMVPKKFEYITTVF